MLKLFGTVVIAGAIFASVSAAAAGLNLTAGTLQAGSDTNLQCDTNGVNVTYNVVFDAGDSRFEVNSLAVGGLDLSCNGAIRVVLTDSANAVLATVDGGVVNGVSGNIAVANVSAEAITGVHVVVQGTF